MASLKATERHQIIMDRLSATGRAEISELADALGVSNVTVRTDLLHLERNQVLRRVRGGAISVRTSRYERASDIGAPFSDEKNAIAARAAQMVRDGETIIMDAGSTVAALAAHFPSDLRDVAVVTNSLAVTTEIANHPGATIIVTGGTLRPRFNSFVSPFGELILNEVNADIAFMSCSGVDAEKGFTNSNWQEAEIKKAMMRSASRVVFLADHSKLKHIATAKIAALGEANLLVTDNKAPTETLKELRAAGLAVEVA